MSELLLDIETYSPVNLKRFGVYAYAAHPEFRILMCAWSLDGSPVTVTPGSGVGEIPGMYEPNVRKVAHNAAFERVCFSKWNDYAPGMFWGPEDWHDTMAVAAATGWPKSLDNLAKALKVEQKDSAGTSLINWFCKPDRNGKRRLGKDHPEKWQQFIQYCAQDVEVLAQVHARLGELPGNERAVWLASERINDRGMAVDLELCAAGERAGVQNKVPLLREIRELVGDPDFNPNSVPQMQVWAEAQGLDMPNFKAEETIEPLLESGTLTPEQHRVLEIRLDLALVAAKKFGTALGAATVGDRLRGGFEYCGAHTGRYAGRRVQPHNLPRLAFLKEDPVTGKEEWDEVSENAAILDLALGNGGSPETLKKLVRSAFLLNGAVFDWNSIEARTLAWMADESWVLEAFRANRDIYVEQAKRMGPAFVRKDGKVAILALGYQGAIEALRRMGAKGTDAELLFLVRQYRSTNPSIVAFWYAFDEVFRTGGQLGEYVSVVKDGVDRHVVLPSGRAISYHGCGWRWVTDPRSGRRKQRASFMSPQGYRQDTYGGKLTENLNQGVARDILADALVRMDADGVPVVGHVHDEVLTECDDLARVRTLMCQVPQWATDLPIDAEGFSCVRYRKG